MKIIDIYIGRAADSGNCIASQELSREGPMSVLLESVYMNSNVMYP